MYKVTCICGTEIATKSTTGTCPACKRGFRLDWRADYKPSEAPKTITEAYDGLS